MPKATKPGTLPTMIITLLLLACGGPTATSTTPVAEAADEATEPAVATAAYDGRFANDPLLIAPQVAAIPPDQLRQARNEVFARHGRAFKSDDLRAHFRAQGWYGEDPNFNDAMLTDNDRANVALIKSFEGDSAAKKVMERGEYKNDFGQLLVFVDKSTAEVIDGSDMYNWNRESRQWTALGEWIVTWEGPKTWNPTDPKVDNAILWKLDHKTGEVLEVMGLEA